MNVANAHTLKTHLLSPRTSSKMPVGYSRRTSSRTPATSTSTPIRLGIPQYAIASIMAGDRVLRDAEQPPADHRQPSPLALRVVDLEACRIIGDLSQREGRVP